MPGREPSSVEKPCIHRDPWPPRPPALLPLLPLLSGFRRIDDVPRPRSRSNGRIVAGLGANGEPDGPRTRGGRPRREAGSEPTAHETAPGGVDRLHGAPSIDRR